MLGCQVFEQENSILIELTHMPARNVPKTVA